MKNDFMNSDMENDLINYESTDCDDVNTNDFMNSDMENEFINSEYIDCSIFKYDEPTDDSDIQDDLLDDEEELEGFEELAERIALEEEIKRIKRAEISLDDFLNQLGSTKAGLLDREGDNVLTEYTLNALGIVSSFKILLEGGVDYQNAIQIANNIYQNKANEKQVGIQNTILEQNAI